MTQETITQDSKEKRDAIYDDLRRTGNRLERQVVKFSSQEMIVGDGGEIVLDEKGRETYKTVWSVAYPRN